jgi:HEAT repeat protein
MRTLSQQSGTLAVVLLALSLTDFSLPLSAAADEPKRSQSAKAYEPKRSEPVKTVSQWLEELSAKDHHDREQAAKALGELKPQDEAVIAALAARLEDKEGVVACEALDALSAIGVKAIPALTGVLADSKDADARRCAAEALGQMGPDAEESVPALRAALKDCDWSIRAHAAMALGKIGPGAKEAVPDLIKTLRDKEILVRHSAATSLGEIGPEARAAVPALIDAFGERGEVQCAAWALERMGPAAKAAVPALAKELRAENQNPLIRETVAATYCKLARGAEAVPLLLELLKHENKKIRADAVGALGEIGPEAKAAVPLLIESLRAKEEVVRRETASVLGRIGPEAKAAVPALLVALTDKDIPVRRRAADALRAIDPDAAKKAGVP